MKCLINLFLLLIFSNSLQAEENRYLNNLEDSKLKSKIYFGLSLNPTNTPFVELSINTSSGRFSCSGTLIARRKVLTAAHCLDEAGIKSVVVRFPGVDSISGRSFKISPGYDSISNTNDAAIITLSRNAPAQIRPMAISRKNPVKGDLILAYGYGLDEQGRSGNFKGAAMTATAVSSTKIFSYGGVRDGYGNTCQGDSGGPGIIKYKSGRQTVYEIVGITSYGTANCFNLDNVFTSVFSPRVSQFIRKDGR